ncbi:MAG: phospho-sugar mutase [Candidatus Izemoplasmatales bacterium]|nr:phospho-sugar mutase [Candidatus Izemoplasmatales bacterium]
MWYDEYRRWVNNSYLHPELRNDLYHKTDAELEDMFFSSLSFGTGGMRGILGAGTNRMNIYTVRKASDGLARYLLERFGDQAMARSGVCIAYDNRMMSKEFAMESCRVLGYYGIRTYLFDNLRPTPELSFAVRYLKCLAGIVITASHNPPNYNGYKIYDEFGCQYTPAYAEKIVSLVEQTQDLFTIPVADFNQLLADGMVCIIGKEVDDQYLDVVKSVQIHPDILKQIKVVFTPLHGTSAELGLRLLSETGYDVFPVVEQLVHDPMFSTVKSPNPENSEAFKLAVDLGNRVSADLLVATDPDADRLGIAVKKGSGYIFLTGNQTGAVLLKYLLSERKKLSTLPEKGMVFNTIVTSDLGAKIARSYGMKVFSTLTGFKFIGEQAKFLEGTETKFVFGYEESYGYVIDDRVRDKDSLQAMLFALEAAAFYRETENKSLYDKLLDIYREYGNYQESLQNIDLYGIEGANRIDRIISYFRQHPLSELGGLIVKISEDYETGIRIEDGLPSHLSLPKSNVIKYILTNDSWIVLRPSGTEPKLKIYVGVNDISLERAKMQNQMLSDAILKIVKQVG